MAKTALAAGLAAPRATLHFRFHPAEHPLNFMPCLSSIHVDLLNSTEGIRHACIDVSKHPRSTILRGKREGNNHLGSGRIGIAKRDLIEQRAPSIHLSVETQAVRRVLIEDVALRCQTSNQGAFDSLGARVDRDLGITGRRGEWFQGTAREHQREQGQGDFFYVCEHV